MKEIEYYEVFAVIDSSTPIDTPDEWYSKDKFEKQEDAEAYKTELDKELLSKIKENPSYRNLHTSYHTRSQTLRLK
ncbi:MAG: hypothetical protein PHV74_14000 [Dehalococcoidia bacterium]|nr:hypothetical protein [Dehalococcoidia bacterium]